MKVKAVEIERNDKMWVLYAPADQATAGEMRKDLGDTLEVSRKKIRSPAQHRFYFKMINIAFQNQRAEIGDVNYFDTDRALRKALQIEAGHYKLEKKLGGETTKVSKSVDHASLSQDDFNVLVGDVRDLICRYIVPDMNPDTLMRETAEQSGVNISLNVR